MLAAHASTGLFNPCAVPFLKQCHSFTALLVTRDHQTQVCLPNRSTAVEVALKMAFRAFLAGRGALPAEDASADSTNFRGLRLRVVGLQVHCCPGGARPTRSTMLCLQKT